MSERPSFDETVDFAFADANPSPAPAVNLSEMTHLQLLGEIARGGMGAILKGRDVDLGRDLAVKVLLETHQGKTEMIQRFIEEAQIAGQLQHPGIAPVHQLGMLSDGRPYFTMKLVKGQTFAGLLAARKDVLDDRPRFLGVFVQVCQTLAYAHAHLVIHRDLKPSNVMVGAFGEVQVMDWGLAKVLKEGGKANEEQGPEPQRADISIIYTQRGDGVSAAESGSYTQAGTLLGTPAYVAPEQARGEVEQVDERADVFGLGAILCEVLTGQPPFTGTGEEIVYKARTAKLEDAFARLEACGADSELIALAKRCLSAEPRDRPRQAGEVAEQVTAYQNAVAERLRQAEMERAAAQIKAQEERKRRKLTLALAASVLLIFLLGGGGWLWLDGQWEARRTENNRAISEALTQATSLREQARTVQGQSALDLAAKAREQARRAEALVERGLTDAELADQVQGLLIKLDAEEKDMQLLAALDAARLAQAETNTERNHFTLERAVPLYREAFRAYGMPAGEGEATAVAARLNERPAAVREAVLAALDDWGALAEGPTWKVKEPHLPWLKAVLTAAEPEGWEKQVREATAEKDVAKQRARLEKLAAASDVEHLPARALTLLAERLSNVRAEASAIALLRKAQLQHAGDFWVHERLGLLLQKKQSEEAVRYLTTATAPRPYSAGANLNLANALRQQGKWDEALAQCKRGIQLAPEYAQAYHVLGLILVEQGRLDEAIAEYKNAIALDPKLVQAYINFGICLNEQGKPVEAIVKCRKAVELGPKFAPAHNALGIVLASQRKWDDALAEHKKALQLDPNFAPAYNALGTVLARQGKRNEAAAQYKKTREIDPKFATAYYNLGLLQADQGKWNEAIAEYKKAIETDPKYAPPRSALGIALMEQGKQDEAATEFQKAIAINPKLALAHGNLAHILAQQGKRDSALAEYRRAVELSPENHDFWNNYAVLCLYQRDKDAYRCCRRDMLARFRDATDPILADRTAKACLLLAAADEELKQASALADRAVAAESPPSWASPYFQLCKGLAEYRQGRIDSAVSWLQKALSNPASEWKFTVPAHLVLALAQHRRGEEEQARKSLAEAVRIYDKEHVAAANETDAWICQILRREAEFEIPSNAKKSRHESLEKPEE